MEAGDDITGEERFERFWRNIEPTLRKFSGSNEARILRYAVKLGFEAGRQSTLRDFFRFVRREVAATALERPEPTPEPA
jgi:hypothetical protein